MNFIQKLYQAQKLVLIKLFFFLPRKIRVFNARMLSVLFCVFEFLTLLTVTLSLLFTLALRSGFADDYLTKITKESLEMLTPEMMGGMWFEVGEISFDEAISIKGFKLNDDYGTWLEVGELSIDFPSLQVLMFFSSIDINSIKGSNISQYRNPTLRPSKEKEEDEKNRGWTVPSIVMPQFLGKINVDMIELDNVFVSKEVMYLSGFDVDLKADVSMKAEISHMAAEFTDVVVREEQTNVTGTITYTPAKFTCDLIAHDRRWGRVFPLIDDAKLHAKIELVAKQLPPNPDFPLTVKLDSDVILSEFFWLKDDVVIDSKVSTFFSFDGANVLFKNTNLYSDILDIEIPHFNLNVDTYVYDYTEAKVKVSDLGVLFNGIYGQSEGTLTFSGEIFDMDAKIDLHTKDFKLDYYSDEYLKGLSNDFLKIVRANDVHTIVTANINLLGERLKLSGYVDAITKDLTLLEDGKNTSLDFETAYLYDIKTFDFTDISLILDEAILHSELLVLDFEKTNPKEDELYIPLIRGKAVIDANNLSFLDKALDLPIQSDAYVELFAVDGQKMHVDAALYNLDFESSQIKELTLNTDVLNFNSFYYGKYPQLEGALIARDVNLKNMSESVNIPAQIFEELRVSFKDPLKAVEDEIDFDIESQGTFALQGKAAINFFAKYLDIYTLNVEAEHIKQKIRLEKEAKLDFASGLNLSPIKLLLSQAGARRNHEAILDLELKYDINFIDLYAKTQIPSLFINSYLKDTSFPTGLFKLDVDIDGSLINPKGKLELAYNDIEFNKNSAKLQLDLLGEIQNNTLNLKADFGRKRKKEFELSASLPLALNTFELFDFNKNFNLDFDWIGNVGTFFQLYPLLDLKVDGNAKVDLTLNGTLAEPKFNGFAYISKASLISDEFSLYLDDIDLELQASEEQTELMLTVKDSGIITQEAVLPQVSNSQQIIIKNNEKFLFVPEKEEEKSVEENSQVMLKNEIVQNRAFYLNATVTKQGEDHYLNADAVMNSFSPYKPDGLNLIFSSKLSANGLLNAPSISGEIFINKASFDFSKLELNSQADRLNNLQIVKDESGIEKVSIRALRRKSFNPKIDVNLIIPDNLIIYGLGLGSVWGGELDINSQNGQLRINGDLKSEKGNFNFLSKNFNLTHSIISFTGDPARPFYEVAFERSNQVIESIVKIKGIGEDLNIELSSNPQMPIDEIISYTLYGKELADLSQFQAIHVGTTTAQLLSPGLQQLNLLNVAKKTFGLDVLTLGSKDSLTRKEIEEENELDDATIEAGTYIGERIYLGVERSFEDTAVKIEVEILPSVDVEARIGTDSSEAEIRWKKNY